MATKSEILQKLRQSPIHRTFAISRGAIDESKRTVDLAFASNKPIEHWFGKLELSMKPGAMRDERLRSGAPLLVEHDRRDQVGVVESHSVGRDGFARATVRFSDSTRGEEIFRDVKNGIRKNVSVGFLIHNLELIDESKGELPTYRSDAWEPFEISIVSVPADIAVGVGRSKEGERMSKENNNVTELTGDLAAADEVRQWGQVLNESAFASDYLLRAVGAGVEPSKDGFFAALRSRDAGRPPAAMPRLSAEEEAFRQGGIYEPAHSIPRHGKVRSFEGPDAERRAYRFGQWLLGGPLGNMAARAWCVQNGLMLSRAQVESVNEKGGFLVPEEFGNDLVDLVERYGVFRQNARVIPMASETRSDPAIAGELNSQFVAEMQEGSESDLDIGMISLTAKKHMVLVPFSSEVNEDSAVSIGDLLAEQCARAFAKKEDLCGFNGDATSAFGGITGLREALKSIDANPANIAGLQVGSGNAYSELTLADFEGVVGRLPEYADTGAAKWYVSRRFYWNVMVKLLLTNANSTASEVEDARNQKFLGYPVVFSQVLPTTEANSQVCALFGDLTLGARLGDRRRITIAIDDSTYFKKDALLLRATSRFDINCAYGVGDTSAAGPIVGLITASS
ncbi:MAG: phage major capsid protein [Pyrinomonadaceae bacterium]